MRNLILLANFFPYGNGEPYLETEVKYYEQYFDLQINLKYSQLKKHLTMFIYLTHLEF